MNGLLLRHKESIMPDEMCELVRHVQAETSDRPDA